MLNRLWAFLILFAVGTGLFNATQGVDSINLMAKALFDSANSAVELSIGLIGAMVLWLGLFRIGEAAGMVAWLSRLSAPIICRLMPDVPRDHPAVASATMNVAMSMMGIDNGALPSGLKTMESLQTLNHQRDTASRAQEMFLVYMTTSVTIFPISIISFRMQSAAANPTDVFFPLLLVSYLGMFSGIFYIALRQKIRLWDSVLLGISFAGVLVLSALAWYFHHLPVAEWAKTITLMGNVALLLSVVGIIVVALLKKTPVYDEFLHGAKDGFGIAIDIIPYLVGMLVAIGLLRASGAFTLIMQVAEFIGQTLGISTQWIVGIPQGIMKAFSGGGARAMMLDSFKVNGVDSYSGFLSAIIQGSSDTTFYILAVCAGAAKLKNLGHAVVGAIIADVVSFAAAVIIATWWYAG